MQAAGVLGWAPGQGTALAPIAVSFPLLFVMGILAEATRYSWDGAAVGWASLMYGPVLLLTVAAHELGHSLAARRVGGHAEGILLWPLGGLAYVAHSSGPKGAACQGARLPAVAAHAQRCWLPIGTWWQAPSVLQRLPPPSCSRPAHCTGRPSDARATVPILVCLPVARPPRGVRQLGCVPVHPRPQPALWAGGGGSRVPGALALVVLRVGMAICDFPGPPDRSLTCRRPTSCAAQLNIALAAFNLLLPAYPLDGGRIFADALLLGGVRPEPAARATAIVATVLGAGVVALGVWRAQFLTIAVGLWMLYVTAELWQAIRSATVEQHPLFSHADGAAGSGYSPYGGSGAV